MCNSRSFRRFTTLLCLALALAVALPAAAKPSTVVAQTSTIPDVGDAPDSTNAPGIGMQAYPGTPARFPTSLLPSGSLLL